MRKELRILCLDSLECKKREREAFKIGYYTLQQKSSRRFLDLAYLTGLTQPIEKCLHVEAEKTKHLVDDDGIPWSLFSTFHQDPRSFVFYT